MGNPHGVERTKSRPAVLRGSWFGDADLESPTAPLKRKSARPVPRRTLFAAAFLGIAGTQARADATALPAAAVPIKGLCDALLMIMKAGRATPFTQRFEMLAPAVDRSLDLPVILRVAVGPRWGESTPEQQSSLLAAFRTYTIATYVANFDNYSNDRFDISPTLRDLGNGEQIVHTTFVPASGDSHVIDYVTHQTGGTWKATDVLLDGTISRVAVLRSDFRHLLVQGGFPALLVDLKQKSADLLGATTAV